MLQECFVAFLALLRNGHQVQAQQAEQCYSSEMNAILFTRRFVDGPCSVPVSMHQALDTRCNESPSSARCIFGARSASEWDCCCCGVTQRELPSWPPLKPMSFVRLACFVWSKRPSGEPNWTIWKITPHWLDGCMPLVLVFVCLLNSRCGVQAWICPVDRLSEQCRSSTRSKVAVRLPLHDSRQQER